MTAYTAVNLPGLPDVVDEPSIFLLANEYASGPPWPTNDYTAATLMPGVRVRIWDTGTLQWITAPSA